MKTKHFNYLAFSIVIIWLFYNLYHGYIYNKEINEFGVSTVGKITKLKVASKRPYLDYRYNINGKRVFSDTPIGIDSAKIGEFYKVIYSSKNPEVTRIYLEEKITDIVAILKAGFSREDIKNMSE
jgi:hypothetical protein